MLARLGRGLLVVGVIVAALGSTNAFADKSFSVELVDFAFKPNAFTVKAGEKVTFTANNTGQRPHNIEIEGNGVQWKLVSSGNVAPGANATNSMTFNTPGNYEFFCPVGNHRAQGMTATFTVTAAAGAATTAAAAPAAVLPKTGEPLTLFGGALAAAGALLTAGGYFIRRRV